MWTERKARPVDVGELVRRRRAELGLKQKAIARHLGVDQSYISQIETGEVKRPSKYFHLLAEVLQIPFSELYMAGMPSEVEFAAEVEGTPTPYRGILPATRVAWDSFVSKGATVPVFHQWVDLANGAPLFVVNAGDARFPSEGIVPGDMVVCMEPDDARPPCAGQVVVLLDGDTYRFAEFAGTTQLADNQQLIGVFFKRYSPLD